VPRDRPVMTCSQKSHRSMTTQWCSPYPRHGVYQTGGPKWLEDEEDSILSWQPSSQKSRQPINLESVRQRNRSADTTPNTNLGLREVSNATVDTAFE